VVLASTSQLPMVVVVVVDEITVVAN